MKIILHTHLTDLTTVSHKTFFVSYKGRLFNYKVYLEGVGSTGGRGGGGCGASKSTIFSVIDMYKA